MVNIMSIFKKQPLVSVLIPCYNAERFVEQAVRSIINQTYKNLEIICINDCSKDRTGEILQKLAIEDNRIIYVENEENLKLPKTLNKGIFLAKGEYIARMDADDIALTYRIEKQLFFLLKNPDLDLISAFAQKIDEIGQKGDNIIVPQNHIEIASTLPIRSTFIHPLILAKKSFFVDLGGYKMLTYGEDYELWLNGLYAGKKYANLPEILLYYRIHSNQMTGLTYSAKNTKSVRNFLWKYFGKTKNLNYLKGLFFQTFFYYFIKKVIYKCIL